MLKTASQRYVNNFKGFSREIWILALITFINRAGTMVVLFLSKYLKEDLHFSYEKVSWILVSFGVGSMLGSWLGGKLSDKIGFYRIMVFSLFVSGLMLFGIRYVTSFYGLCISMFLFMTVADMYRPAMFVSLGAYTKPENRTRALTLVRLAINLGFAAGPAIGGLIIMTIGYGGLFWIDGGTCIIAILIFALKVKEKKKTAFRDKEHPGEVLTHSVFRDKPFMFFLFTCLVSGVLFFQVFTTIPLYHRIQFNLTEFQTGLLLTMNGLLIFLLEMPIVSYVERKKLSKIKVVAFGCLMMSISLFLMLVNWWVGILVVMMVFMTFGEMFAFPFSNSVGLSRAPKGHEGRYMAIYTMSYSLAHIFSAKAGMGIVGYYTRHGYSQQYAYNMNWVFMGVLGLLGMLCGLWVYKLTQKEATSSKSAI